MTPVSLCFLARRRPETGDRFEKENGRGFFLPQGRTNVSAHVSTSTQCQILYCYTCGLLYAGATQGELPEGQEKVPWGDDRVAQLVGLVATDSICEFQRSVQSISAGPVYHNVLTNCAALLCRTQRRVARMCSSTLSDPANTRIHGRAKRVLRKEKSSAVLLLAAVAGLWSAPDYPRERGDSQEGGNRRCLPSCAPARRQRTFPPPQRRIPV